jgi:hypothetical protein
MTLTRAPLNVNDFPEVAFGHFIADHGTQPLSLTDRLETAPNVINTSSSIPELTHEALRDPHQRNLHPKITKMLLGSEIAQSNQLWRQTSYTHSTSQGATHNSQNELSGNSSLSQTFQSALNHSGRSSSRMVSLTTQQFSDSLTRISDHPSLAYTTLARDSKYLSMALSNNLGLATSNSPVPNGSSRTSKSNEQPVSYTQDKLSNSPNNPKQIPFLY